MGKNTSKTPAVYLSPYFSTFMEPGNRFQGKNYASLCSLPGRYDNPIPPRFLAPIDCLKTPALVITMLTDGIEWNWSQSQIRGVTSVGFQSEFFL